MEGGQKNKYHGAQIHVPPELPEILKQFTKTAIKVQPQDVLAWSAAYFRALASGESKDSRWQNNRNSNLTPSLLRVLNKQHLRTQVYILLHKEEHSTRPELGPLKIVPLSLIKEKWTGLALPEDQFDALVQKGRLSDDTDWTVFFSLACLSLSQNLTDAMTLSCDVLATECDGRVPFVLFMNIYRYLATEHYGISSGHVDYIVGYLDDNFAKNQNGFITPKNFLRTDYPGLSG